MGIASEAVSETPAWVYRVIFGISAFLGVGSLTLTFLVQESDPTALGVNKGPAIDEIMVAIETESKFRKGWNNLPVSYWSVLGILVLFSFANSSETFLLLRVREMLRLYGLTRPKQLGD